MKQRRKKKRLGNVQGYALLYGRSSKAIRIVNGEEKNSTRGGCIIIGRKPKNAERQKPRTAAKISRTAKPVQKKYRMSDEAKMKLDRLQDPLDMMNRTARAQKYDAANSSEKYEYGLSDW